MFTKKRLRKRVASISVVTFGLLAIQIGAFAAMTWSNTETMTLNGAVEEWVTSNTYNAKTTEDDAFDVFTVATTAWSNPSFRLVNSEGAVRSKTITMPNTGHEKTGGGNTGEVGHWYYGSLKPHLLQHGTDTIKFQFKSR